MKIGILTLYYNNANYGGLLQAYALQRFLTLQGHNCEQICWDFNNAIESYKDFERIRKDNVKKHNFVNKSVNNKITLERVANKIYRTVIERSLKKRKKAFKDFEIMIPHSSKIYNPNNSVELANEYDVIVVGSDQIWNIRWYCPEHFLKFDSENCKKLVKISYAASMPNGQLTNFQIGIVSSHLQSFTAISVREQDTARYLESVCNKSVEYMPDPTFLLDKNEWLNLVGEKKVINKEYIFCYLLGENSAAKQFAIDLSKKTNKKIVTFANLSSVHYKNEMFGDKRLYDVSPAQFLNLIRNATYVITDSFHASVFSIIFQTKFLVFPRTGNDEGGVRIKNLLHRFNLERRLIGGFDNQNESYSIINENVNDASGVFKQCSNEAIEFFYKALNDK